jgi:hypothetical protein
MKKNKIKQTSYAFYAPQAYKEAGHSGTDFRDAVNTLFPIIWNNIPTLVQQQLQKQYREEFDALDLREES